MSETGGAPRVLVFAYQDVGYVCLQELICRGVQPVAVFTHADAPGENIWFRSVAALAAAHGIAVHTPESVNTQDWIGRIRELRPDLVLSFYYRDLIGTPILDMPALGAFNLHGSLLPRYRGRAPVNWALVSGEPQTGVTLHRMVARADAGDIVDQQPVAIGPRDSIREVYDGVVAAARKVITRQVEDLLNGQVKTRPQDETQASVVRGRRPDDGRIDWRWDARTVFNLVRAVTHPYPGAFTDVQGRRLYIWWAEPTDSGSAPPGEVTGTAPLSIACSRGTLRIRQWQWENGQQQRDNDGTDHGLRVGQRLGNTF
ncbi:MAG: formyltransferase [Gammaproteobacteria bacterium]